MTISVLMSVYKSEKPEFLAQALKSVWEEQTCKPAQIVLIEDGPLTAGLYTVIDRYKDILGDRMCICRNETNQGLTKSLNIGLRQVTSELVARMDSDDRAAPRRFERQAAFLEQHPDVDIVGVSECPSLSFDTSRGPEVHCQGLATGSSCCDDASAHFPKRTEI